MELDGLTIIEAASGLPLFSKLQPTLDETLFSGFLSAITSFTKELSLGGLSSFTTDEKHVYLVAREKIVVAVIAATSVDPQPIYSLAYHVGVAFEDSYKDKLTSGVKETTIFEEFDATLTEILNKGQVPFIIQVAEFARKEYGGKVAVQPQLKQADGVEVTLDLVVDRGEKSGGSIRDKIVKRHFKAFSADVTFLKVVDGTAGRGEVEEFLEQTQKFGFREAVGEEDDRFPYFPNRAVVVAKAFSTTVFESLEQLQRQEGKAYIAGTHIIPTAKLRASPKTFRCFVEVWKWNEASYPERVFK